MPNTIKWRKFEQAVADIQGLFTPNAEIKRNVRLVDRLGHRREFDVVIEDNWGGRNLLAVIECKDLSRKVGITQVEAFQEKTEKIRANFRAIVSAKGFSKQALEAAEHYGIGVMSLLPDDEKIAGFAVYLPAYAEIWRWTKLKLTVKPSNRRSRLGEINVLNVRYDGKSVFAWFLRKLKEEYLHLEEEGALNISVIFEKKTILSIDGRDIEADGIVFEAFRERKRKHKPLRITGDAFYDWQDRKLKWPSRGAIVLEEIDTYGVDDWDDYEGDFPSPSDNREKMEKNEIRIQFIFKFFGRMIELEDEIAELDRL